jgi:sulfofructose kinase
MSNILLLANLSCDRVLQLEKTLTSGDRHLYKDKQRRLGGSGANTGVGLVMAGHHVTLECQVGNDKTADWLLAEASVRGLDCHLLKRDDLVMPETLLIMTPDGKRTIMRPHRPTYHLSKAPHFSQWDAVYIKTSARGAEAWAKAALHHTLVVAQLAKDERPRPCHILIASLSHLIGRNLSGDSTASTWEDGLHIAGPHLRYFVVTDGKNGATAHTKDKQFHIPAAPAKIVDITGAGDAFAAGLIDGLVRQLVITEAMTQGAQWAAIAATTDSSIPGEALRQYIVENKKQHQQAKHNEQHKHEKQHKHDKST